MPIAVLLVAFARMCQGQNLPEARELVERYREAVSWNQRVSMRVHTKIDSTSTDKNYRVYHQEMNLIHRRDGNRVEWLVSKNSFEDEKHEVPKSSEELVLVSNGKSLIVGNKKVGRDAVYVGSIRRQNYENALRLSLGDYYYGGFLSGVGVVGQLEPNLGDFISRYDTLRVIGKVNINKTACYIVEARTEHGTIKVWIAPEKGYNALKVNWVIHDNDFLSDGLYLRDSSFVEWSVVIDSIEVQKIDGIFVPVSGRFIKANKSKEGVEKTVRVKVKQSEIDLNPDFEALGAFGLPLPDGSRIYDHDYPGIGYEVIGGKLVPNVDEYAVEQIDKITEELMAEGQVPTRMTTAKKTEAVPNQPAGIAKTQVTTEEAQGEILSESRPFLMLVFVLIGLSIIAIIAWRVFLLKKE